MSNITNIITNKWHGLIMKICNRNIGIHHTPLVIVEIGINHGGSLETALKMVNAAYDAGAEVIKHQTHVIEDEMSLEAKFIKPVNSSSKFVLHIFLGSEITASGLGLLTIFLNSFLSVLVLKSF